MADGGLNLPEACHRVDRLRIHQWEARFPQAISPPVVLPENYRSFLHFAFCSCNERFSHCLSFAIVLGFLLLGRDSRRIVNVRRPSRDQVSTAGLMVQSPLQIRVPVYLAVSSLNDATKDIGSLEEDHLRGRTSGLIVQSGEVPNTLVDEEP